MLEEGLNVKSSRSRVRKLLPVTAAKRCEQRGAVHSESVKSKETDGEQWSALMIDRIIRRTLDLTLQTGIATGIAT